jgi:PASTA domain
MAGSLRPPGREEPGDAAATERPPRPAAPVPRPPVSGFGEDPARFFTVLFRVMALVSVTASIVISSLSDGPRGRPLPLREATTPGVGETTPGITVVVPDPGGLSALEARRELAATGLTLAGVRPTPGTPGVVVRSTPEPGREVSAGTWVTLYVGVEPKRYERETSPPPPPG